MANQPTTVALNIGTTITNTKAVYKANKSINNFSFFTKTQFINTATTKRKKINKSIVGNNERKSIVKKDTEYADFTQKSRIMRIVNIYQRHQHILHSYLRLLCLYYIIILYLSHLTTSSHSD